MVVDGVARATNGVTTVLVALVVTTVLEVKEKCDDEVSCQGEMMGVPCM